MVDRSVSLRFASLHSALCVSVGLDRDSVEIQCTLRA